MGQSASPSGSSYPQQAAPRGVHPPLQSSGATYPSTPAAVESSTTPEMQAASASFSNDQGVATYPPREVGDPGGSFDGWPSRPVEGALEPADTEQIAVPASFGQESLAGSEEEMTVDQPLSFDGVDAPTAPSAIPLAFREASAEVQDTTNPSMESIPAAYTPQVQYSDRPGEMPASSGRKPLPRPRLQRGFVFAPKVELPSLFRRVCAGSIDIAVVALVAFGAMLVFGPKITHSFPQGIHGMDLMATLLKRYTPQASFFFISFAILLFVYTLVLHGLRGQTLGKMALGLKVIDRNGQPLSILSAFARSVAFLIFFFLGMVGVTWILFDKEYRALHDRLAGSLVVRNPSL